MAACPTELKRLYIAFDMFIGLKMGLRPQISKPHRLPLETT
jgi:hypothetical protein